MQNFIKNDQMLLMFACKYDQSGSTLPMPCHHLFRGHPWLCGQLTINPNVLGSCIYTHLVGCEFDLNKAYVLKNCSYIMYIYSEKNQNHQ